MAMKVQTAVSAEAFKQKDKHRLFVEGSGPNALDPLVMKELFKDRIDVKALGASSNIRCAAESLYPHDPHSYFLIDRDHHDDEVVEAHWNNFPDPAKYNLLIWRRKELENYFLIPEYLYNSAYIAVSKDELMGCIIAASQRRLFIDAANKVVVGIREQLKENWIDIFTAVEEFATKDAAIEKLRNTPEFSAHPDKISERLTPSLIAALFEAMLEKLTGGCAVLEYDSGQWLELLSGKKIYASIVQQCFKVKAPDNRLLQGKLREKLVATELLQQDLSKQPADFQQLHHLIISKLGQS